MLSTVLHLGVLHVHLWLHMSRRSLLEAASNGLSWVGSHSVHKHVFLCLAKCHVVLVIKFIDCTLLLPRTSVPNATLESVKCNHKPLWSSGKVSSANNGAIASISLMSRSFSAAQNARRSSGVSP